MVKQASKEKSLHKWEGAIEVPIDRVAPNEWNPNVMPDHTFANLVQEIEKDGFDEPVIVCPDPEQKGHYRIVNGEHRWRAASMLGHKVLPVVVKEDWDEATQKLKTVRRNILRGDLDAAKFDTLIADIQKEHELSEVEIASAMGFASLDEMQKAAAHTGPVDDSKDAGEQAEEEGTKRARKLIDGLEQVVNHLLSEYGHTVPHGFVYFLYGGEMHLAVDMDGDLKGLVDTVTRRCDKEDRPVADVLGEVLGAHVATYGDVEPEKTAKKTKAKKAK